MDREIRINSKNIFIFFSLYLSLFLGFYYGENLNYGSKNDWFGADLSPIKDFSEEFVSTLLNYDSYNHRHSPVYLIFLSLLHKAGITFDLIRFIHLNLSMTLIYVFFKCLKLKFKEVDQNILFLISISILLSPTFRSLSIWPDTRLIGLIIFTFSIYEFLKFQETKSKIFFYKSIFFIIMSSYVSPNFSVFIIFYFINYFKKISFIDLIYGLLICIFLSLPAFYYLFILDVNFLLAQTPGVNEFSNKSFSLNISNKLMIISTIIFFHLFPFILNRNFFNGIIKFFINNLIFILPFFFINIIFFNYSISFTGGGFFFQLSNYLINNNLIFYFFCCFSFGILGYFIISSYNNLVIFLLLIFSNIQNTIYHKYFDPLILILFFTVLNHFTIKDFLNKKNNLIYLYLFYFAYIIMRIVKNIFFLH